MTYTVRQMETNSWTVDSDGKYHSIEKWNCGHKHRSVEAALNCLNKLNGWTRSIGSAVYDSTGQMYDCNGERV